MFEYRYYRVSTPTGGGMGLVRVDKRYDTPEERQHRAWCTILEDERSPHYKMLRRIIAELGVDRAKKMFCAALVFELEIETPTINRVG